MNYNSTSVFFLLSNKAIYSLCMILFLVTACNGKSEFIPATVEEKSVIDSTIAIIPYDTAYYWTFKNAKATSLTNDDLQIIETIILDCIDKYNADYDSVAKSLKAEYPWYKLQKEKYIIELKNYKRQYVPVINSDGHKMVWVNFFCNTFHKEWQKSIVMFSDGGNCYFKLKINLNTKKCYDLRVNGTA